MRIHFIPTLKDNYSYLIETDKGSIIVDCGEAKPVIEFLEAHKIVSPSHILCTHHHGDHIDGFGELKERYPDIEIIAPEADRDRIPLMDMGVKDGDIVNIGDIRFIAIHTPGHTRNHICYYAPSLNALFTGDTLFSLGCGRLFEGTPEEMFGSVEKLKKLPDETQLYFGHEYARTNLEFSLQYAPGDTALRNRRDKVMASDGRNISFIGNAMLDEKRTSLFLRARSVSEFAALRQARNNF